MELNNKVAVITGGLGGIGFTTVQYFLKHGIGYVAIFDLYNNDHQKVIGSLQILEKAYDKNKFGYFPCDVTKYEQFKASFEKVIKLKHNVDIFFNNAGVYNDINVDLNIDLNYKAVAKGTLMALEHMRTDKGGKGGVILNMSSTAGLQNLELSPIYNASKHAVVSLVRSMKGLDKRLGVRTVCLCPDFVDTPLIDKDNLIDNSFDFVEKDKIEPFLKEIHINKTETIAFAVAEIIKRGEEGCCWTIYNDVAEGVIEINEAMHLRYPLS